MRCCTSARTARWSSCRASRSGSTDSCWPERLIGDLPNVYLYASNNSSEGTLAKRRGGATLVSYLTPPIANAGLYKELIDLKATLERWRSLDDSQAARRRALRSMLQEQAWRSIWPPPVPAWTQADGGADRGRAHELIEVEHTLIPLGLHVVGRACPGRRARRAARSRTWRPDADVHRSVRRSGCGGSALSRAVKRQAARERGTTRSRRCLGGRCGRPTRRRAEALDTSSR
ncbi:MAG: cobaltochelatase subunit CobN [Gemmatimonadaceae bacterium]|nr:cobaltochelatase subunit CobN [Gemmatimonadaceae bacterium]